MFDDFLDTIMQGGASGRGWRSAWAILGLVIGAGVGAYAGYTSDGIAAAFGGLASGALVGWVLGVFLRGFAFFLIILALAFGFMWLTGELA